MEGDQLMFDLDQGFAQGFTQEQVDGKLDCNIHLIFQVSSEFKLL